MTNYLSFLRYFKVNNIKNRLFYLKYLSFIDKAQWWSKEENENYQWNKIKYLLNYSFKYIPYYKEMFLKMGATPDDIKTWADFKRIPYLTKETVRDRAADFLPIHIRNVRSLKYCSTSGSTGEPLGFYKSKIDNNIEWAFMVQQWKRVGYHENSKRIIIRGEPIEDGHLFQRYRFTNDWLASSYHLSNTYIKRYVDFLNQLKPDFFHVYPSSLFIFTQILLESGLNLDFYPKAILSGSEPIHDYQRELFEKTFKTRVYTWLGQAEGIILAGECEHSTSLHVWPQYSYVELLDENGSDVSEKGSIGSIIGTSFNSFITPFIRYTSGDLAIYGGNECNLCGRNHLLFDRIEGRMQSILILSDGREMPFQALDYMIHSKIDAYRRIKKMQIVQDVKGEVIIKLSVMNNFSIDDESEIMAKLGLGLNDQLSIKIEYTDNFIRTKNGKNVDFIQRVKSYN